MDDFKENNVYVSRSTNTSPKVPPLSNKNSLTSMNSMSSLNSSKKPRDSSPLLPPIKLEKTSTGGSSVSVKEYKRLDRQYGELLIKFNNTWLDFNQLQQELTIKNNTINDQLQQISNYEKFLTNVKIDYNNTKEILEKELLYYKEMIEDYQFKFIKLNNELDYYKKLEFTELESYVGDDTNDEKYNKLLKDFKILKSNFELEQNSKIILMDQIDYLTKENTQLKDHVHSLNNSNDLEYDGNFDGQNFDYVDDDDSVIHDLSYNYNTHTMNEEDEEEEEYEEHEQQQDDDNDDDADDIDQIGSDDSSDIALDYLNGMKNQAQSSPIKQAPEAFATPKEQVDRRNPSLIHSENFQFPPSPDPNSKTKRQSLPANLKDQFILSPLKLASNDFEGMKPHQRYSMSKPNHSRYSSHEILPIKVEFENDGLRSSSVPENEHNKFEQILEEEFKNNDAEQEEEKPIKDIRESTFKQLNGGINGAPGDRSSLITNGSSSKRTSLIFEQQNNLTNNDLTKQEIMKLKFELQSLKLHNEKLLSYIGFELQKQKKNIKKLSSQQNLRKQVEYNDNKLIERSRELLIQKKRVLRSASINTILSKNYGEGRHRKGNEGVGILTKGILPFNQNNQYEEQTEEEVDDEDNDNDNDDYGFLNFNDKFNKRIFSNGLNHYYEVENTGNNLKKFKSQVFNHNNAHVNDFDSTLEEIDEGEDWEDTLESVNNSQEEDSIADISQNIGLFSQIKYLITGSHSMKKKSKRVNDSSVDDSLRYQFFSIAIGILIIGIRFGHYNHHNQITN